MPYFFIHRLLPSNVCHPSLLLHFFLQCSQYQFVKPWAPPSFIPTLCFFTCHLFPTMQLVKSLKTWAPPSFTVKSLYTAIYLSLFQLVPIHYLSGMPPFQPHQTHKYMDYTIYFELFIQHCVSCQSSKSHSLLFHYYVNVFYVIEPYPNTSKSLCYQILFQYLNVFHAIKPYSNISMSFMLSNPIS